MIESFARMGCPSKVQYWGMSELLIGTGVPSVLGEAFRVS